MLHSQDPLFQRILVSEKLNEFHKDACCNSEGPIKRGENPHRNSNKEFWIYSIINSNGTGPKKLANKKQNNSRAYGNSRDQEHPLALRLTQSTQGRNALLERVRPRLTRGLTGTQMLSQKNSLETQPPGSEGSHSHRGITPWNLLESHVGRCYWAPGAMGHCMLQGPGRAQATHSKGVWGRGQIPPYPLLA